MPKSTSLQLGKAAEHLVCFDLIRQGYNAFLADQGCGFDIVVETDAHRIYRIQVKARSNAIDIGKSKNVYRFLTRRGIMTKGNPGRVVTKKELDFIVCVAMDIQKIAYLPVRDFSNKDGSIFQCIELKTLDSTKGEWIKGRARVFEHYSEFKL